MEPRTEAEILAQAPLKVFFGDKQYDIKPLTILKSRAWREKLSGVFGSLVETFLQRSTSLPQTSELLSSGIIGALIQCPEKITELLFEYAPDLPRDEVLANATDAQVVTAFEGIFGMAFPFLAILGTMKMVVNSGALPKPPKASYTN